MRPPKRFFIVTKGQAGTEELTPMWDWVRRHPLHQPPGFSGDRNSHWVRDALRRMGWSVQETENDFRLFPPDGLIEGATVPTDGESTDPVAPAGDETPAEQFEFALESHLRDFLVRNLSEVRVGGKRLRVFVDEAKRGGVEYPTDVGLIDVLAVDDRMNFVVFELKLTRGPDRAMGQLARYMGWVKQHLASGREVHGVLLAKDMDEKLQYAALAVPNVTLLEYEVSFKWREATLKS